jgi:hypothetical protein
MNKAEFNKAFQLARVGLHTSFKDLTMFEGFGHKGFSVCCTLRDMAGLITYQALQFNGEWDNDAVNEIWDCRRKFIIADA